MIIFSDSRDPMEQ